jgi:hypothetical protein
MTNGWFYDKNENASQNHVDHWEAFRFVTSRLARALVVQAENTCQSALESLFYGIAIPAGVSFSCPLVVRIKPLGIESVVWIRIDSASIIGA